MKLFKYGLPLAALAVLASCSNDNNQEPAQGTTPSTGDTYMALSIAMPGDSYTRAENDVTLADGDPKEYAVKNGVVYIFKKGDAEKEGDYTFVTSSDLKSTIWEKDNADNNDITSTAKTAVFEFDGVTVPATATDLYALIILNRPEGLTAPNKGTKFSVWNAELEEAKVMGSTTAGLTMTNAALLTNGKVGTLVWIDNTKIGTSPQNLSPAACVYVQRVAAKVELSNTELITVTGGKGDQVEIVKWNLNYTNKKAFPVQKADNYIQEGNTDTWFATTTAPDYFTSATAFKCDLETATHKRIYWAEDPNYDKKYTASGTAASEDFNINTATEVTKSLSEAIYCLENTMVYSSMYQNQTTQFVFEATYWVGGKPTENVPENAPSFIVVDSWKATEASLNANALVVAKADDEIDDVDSNTPSVQYIKFQLQASALGQGFYSVVGLTDAGKTAYKKSIKATEDLTAAQEKEGLLYFIGMDQISEDTKADFYLNGKMYYAAPILHFDGIAKPSGTNGIGKYSESHLGRFGLVRNNWYVLTVNTISGLGDIKVPEPGDDVPDDPDDKSYIQCEVHILSWAKRTSGYDF